MSNFLLSLASLFVALLTEVADALRPGLAEDCGPDAAKVQSVDHLRPDDAAVVFVASFDF